jgi:DNA-binding GntR family transcriptional regulator
MKGSRLSSKPGAAQVKDLLPVERPKTMKQHVYEALQRAILQGAIDASTVLTEATLAEKFGVSRTPVREVMQELQSQGLLEPAGLRGKRVRRISRDEVRELFWIRSALEPPIAVRLAKLGISSSDANRIQGLLAAQQKALKQGDRLAFLTADSNFHILLAQLTGFPKVAGIITNLRNVFQIVGLTAITKLGRLEEVIKEHQSIVEAILRRDPKEAERAVRFHLEHTEEIVMERLGLEDDR